MSGIISRFRRKTATPRSVSPSSEPAHVEEKNIPLPSEKVVGASEQSRRSYDPEVAADPIGADDESEIEEDLKDIPVEVRNTVSFEDDQNLPTITFRYFLLTFLFVAPGAFLYQMVRTNSTRSTNNQLTIIAGSISDNICALLSLLCSDRCSLCRSVAGEDPTGMGSKGPIHQVSVQLEPRSVEHQGACACDNISRFWSYLESRFYAYLYGSTLLWGKDTPCSCDIFHVVNCLHWILVRGSR
jgi:hypothetical protein